MPFIGKKILLGSARCIYEVAMRGIRMAYPEEPSPPARAKMTEGVDPNGMARSVCRSARSGVGGDESVGCGSAPEAILQMPDR